MGGKPALVQNDTWSGVGGIPAIVQEGETPALAYSGWQTSTRVLVWNETRDSCTKSRESGTPALGPE